MKNTGKPFAVLLTLSGLVTAFLGSRTLLDPEGIMEGFGVPGTPEGLELLVSVLGAAIVSLAAIVFLAAYWSWQENPAGRVLGVLSAITLLFVAICAFAFAGSTQVLLLDGIRGTVLLVVGLLWKPDQA